MIYTIITFRDVGTRNPPCHHVKEESTSICVRAERSEKDS